MDWIFTGAAVFAVWAAMSFVGYERQRRLDELNAAAAPVAEEQPSASAHA